MSKIRELTVISGSLALASVTNKSHKQPVYLSRPSAGLPASGDDSIEKSLDLNDLLINNPDSTFFVRVEGDSMEGAGIFSGDILVIDRSVATKSGQIVVAAVFGEMVVKRLEIIRGKLRLLSENSNYEPIEVNDTGDCHIWGVVIGSVRDFR